MKSGPGDESLMVMTVIDGSSTYDLSSQKPAPESSPYVLTPVSSHETVDVPVSTTSSQLKVDTEENTLVPKEESTNASISEAPKAERVENVFDGFDGPKVRKYLLTEEHDFIILNNDKRQGRLSKYLVSKDVLSVSSPVLRSLIKPSTQNQTVQAQKPAFENINAPPTAIMRTGNTLQLEHDEYSLYRILSIIHFCSTVDKLHNLDFKAWKGLTVLAETYQWTQVLRPWKSIWVRKHGTSFLLPGYEDWLYLSKVYGSDYQVDALTRTLSLYCRFNGRQISRYDSITGSVEVLNTKIWPAERKARILSLRKSKVEHMLSCLEALELMLGSQGDSELGRKLCNSGNSNTCRALAYGSLLQSIKASELDPEFSEWEGSVAELHEQIESLAFSTLGIVIKEHKCVIQGLKKSLSFCLTSFGLLDLQSRHDEMILRASSL
ncbi:hypothetical protein AOL_s00080g387 [Orbilia oligospora ATCC 24927]|uniref:BTB domain-containing protein n=1 Tax=Arthrobotrys oligospora (strain ATCC 24927 / CBS 115.81 / DSM 1491) TaxID=756982 RepID=G1XF02_ARTOA|nr:hypothetical protein AOL_s00080g387 [Orbilia oligospora ATCC 24927]EGX48262.1 hypothetical protein AOL_s00080g387 [Orbilia oligospora ATCC 24927]